MPTYASAADVWGMFVSYIQPDNPQMTDPQVDLIITRYEGRVHGLLKGKGYTIPIDETTSPESFQMIKRGVMEASATDVYIELNKFGEIPDRVRLWRDEWLALVENLENAEFELPDAQTPDRQGTQLSFGSLDLNLTMREEDLDG